MNQNTFNKLTELSGRILSGEVVFFIGAGFSLDSEGNSAKRFMGRLIVRFDAVTGVLSQVEQGDLKDGEIKCDQLRKTAGELRHALATTFDLPVKDDLIDDKNITALSLSYYQLNDWICSAYSLLLEQMKNFKNEKKGTLCEQIKLRENELRSRINDDRTPDKIPLEAIELDKYLALNSYMAGKALFLDTMGFDNTGIMGGSPCDRDINVVLKSYRQRLLKRHHILARLAREGLSNPLITTNYDLLLEGAYRLAGFIPLEWGEEKTSARVLIPYFECIADAGDFFNYGFAHRTAVITKIHGCVNRYRCTKKEQCKSLLKNKKKSVKADHNSGNKYWEKYLPSMVFTFREIQNWREDAWSRDYVRTLLRTRTIVFCGYSGADPVLHDTFRSVYEEMEKQSKRCVPGSSNKSIKAKIPVFFFGSSQKRGFHGMEILRAASKAVGIEPYDVTNHENYLQFYKNKKKDKFPHLDELLLWIYHLTCREVQGRCLESNLQQISMHLLEHPCPLRELEIIKEEFQLLFGKEKERATGWDDKSRNRDALYRATNWSEYFHTGFLKEYAYAEDQMLGQGVRGKTGDKASPSWYYPFRERPGWTAWAVVVEIALRKMISHWQGNFDNWKEDKNLLEAIPSVTPALCYSRTDMLKTPILLALKFRGASSVKSSLKLSGAFSQKRTWYLNQGAIPWVKEDYRGIPGANIVWKWAVKSNQDAGNMDKEDIDNLNKYFGKKDEYWKK